MLVRYQFGKVIPDHYERRYMVKQIYRILSTKDDRNQPSDDRNYNSLNNRSLFCFWQYILNMLVPVLLYKCFHFMILWRTNALQAILVVKGLITPFSISSFRFLIIFKQRPISTKSSLSALDNLFGKKGPVYLTTETLVISSLGGNQHQVSICHALPPLGKLSTTPFPLKSYGSLCNAGKQWVFQRVRDIHCSCFPFLSVKPEMEW